MVDTRDNIKTQRRDSKGRVMADTPTLPLLKALNDAFQSIRQRNADVPNVVLVVGTSSSKKHGHFDPLKWSAKNAGDEIMLSGESLRRNAEDVFGTLLHEAAHAAAFVRGIKDTSRQNRYHNKEFKKIGEEFGLILTHDGSIGWSITSVPETTRAIYKTEISAIRKALKAHRLPPPDAEPTEKTTIRVKCGCDIPVTVPISWWDKHGEHSMICSDCGAGYMSLDDWIDDDE